MKRDELFYGKNAGEYYDKLMSGNSNSNYLQTKNSYKLISKIIYDHLKKINPEGESLLEVGCGTGNFCIEFAKLGLKVKGTDYSKDLLKSAKKKKHKNIITYAFSDMRSFSEKKKFDYLVCLFDTFRYNQSLKEAEQTLKNFYNTLNKKGIVVLDAYYGKETTKEIKIELPRIKMSNGLLIQETVFSKTKGNKDIKKSNQKIYKNEKLIKELKIKRLPRIRIRSEKIKELLQKTGFKKIKILKGYDNKGKKENIVVIAVK